MSARTLIALTGTDRVAFLQNLVTNDIQTTASNGLTYAALLTPQGKFIADFFVATQSDALLLDVATSHAPTLAQRLNLYRLRSQVEITQSPLKVALGAGGYADPRHPDLPHRIYGDTDHMADPLDLRLRHIIPETGIELTPDTYILEAGFERLNGVSFTKGCYIGQEIVARMKHKTTLKKGLTRLRINGTAPIGTAITVGGKPAGTLYSHNASHALAHMRFDRLAENLVAETATLSPDM